MTYKKTKLSYFLWFIYTCVTGVMLADYTMLLWKKQINSAIHMYMIGFVFLFFALVAGLFFLLKKVFAKALENNGIHEHTALMWEIFAVLGAFAIGILYRLYLCMQNGAGAIVETDFYQMAIVREGRCVEPLVHGASYLYVQFLSIVFSFLGNKVMAAVWVQILVQMLTILLSYFVIKKMLGRISACVVMLMLAISVVYAGQILALTPETLFFMLYIIGLFITGSYVKAYCLDKLSDFGKVFGAVFTGIIIGTLTYLDAVSLTLFIILAGLITGVHITRRKAVSVLSFLVSAATCVLTVAGAFLLDSYASGDSIEVICNAWVKLYTGQPWLDTVVYNNYSMTEYIVQVILAALLILSFWNHREVQNSTPWMCLMLILAPMPLSGVSVLKYQVFYVFIWSVLAGLGLQQSLGLEWSDNRDENVESEELVTAGTGNRIENVVEETPTEHIAENHDVKDDEKPRFIENPLPLPKKHEKKELDYQYYVPEHKMKYDIEVAENDDFEI